MCSRFIIPHQFRLSRCVSSGHFLVPTVVRVPVLPNVTCAPRSPMLVLMPRLPKLRRIPGRSLMERWNLKPTVAVLEVTRLRLR